MLPWVILHCIVLFVVLSGDVLYRNALIVLYGDVLCCVGMYCVVLLLNYMCSALCCDLNEYRVLSCMV